MEGIQGGIVKLSAIAHRKHSKTELEEQKDTNSGNLWKNEFRIYFRRKTKTCNYYLLCKRSWHLRVSSHQTASQSDSQCMNSRRHVCKGSSIPYPYCVPLNLPSVASVLAWYVYRQAGQGSLFWKNFTFLLFLPAQ